MNDTCKDDDYTGLDDEEDDRVFGIIMGWIDVLEDAALRSCTVRRGAGGSRGIDRSGDELRHRGSRHAERRLYGGEEL